MVEADALDSPCFNALIRIVPLQFHGKLIMNFLRFQVKLNELHKCRIGFLKQIIKIMKGKLLHVVSIAFKVMLLVTIGFNHDAGATVSVDNGGKAESDIWSDKVPYQSRIVIGKVTSGEDGSEMGSPLPGVNVLIKGTATGTVTDLNGEFRIEILSEETVLVFSYVGYISEEVRVGASSRINMVLLPDIATLHEIVVVGYGEQKKLTTTGAITSVSGADLVKAPVPGISNALIGLTSGIQAVQTTGEFGADKADIRIRGIATLNTAGAAPLILVDGVERETYNNIDPNSIESINVLKDASSTAVFGVRGANGVIIITTKQGKPGKPQLNFTANAAALQPSILPDLLNSYDYAVLRNEAQTNKNKAPGFTDDDLEKYRTGVDPVFYPDMDWIDELIKDFSIQQSYNLNISGGSESLRYFASLGYFNQSGGYHAPKQDLGFPFKHDYDRYNIRMNFDFDLTDDLVVSVKLGNQVTDNYIPNGGAWGAFDKATSYPPMSSPGFIDGKYIMEVKGLPAGVPNYNPWAQAGPTSTGGAFVNENFSNTLNTNLSLKYNLDKITEGLSVRAMGAYDSYYNVASSRSKYFPAYTVMRDPANPDHIVIYSSADEGPFHGMSRGITDSNKWRKMYGEAAVEYKRLFANAHHVTALVLGNMQKAYIPSMEYKLPTAYLGLVGRVTYDYKERYLTEFNMGYNGSENFPEGKRFGFFPSFSAGWVASNESFFPKNELLTLFKIRGSYGEVGNDKIGGSRYLYLDGPYSLASDRYRHVVFGEAGINMISYQMYKEGRIGNHDVTWERAKKWNAGIEMKLFGDRVSIIGDYFEEKRDNILWGFSTIPEYVAVQLPAANIGSVENYGYEIEASFNDKIGDLNYWVKGLYSFARNKIIYQDEVSRAYEWMQRTGRPIGQYFGLTFEGFYNSWDEINDSNRPISQWEGDGLAPGDMKYKDLNKDGKITTEDMGPIGYSNWPEINYSFSFGASLKGWDLSVLFQGTDNVSVRYDSKIAYPFTADWGPAQTWHLERWTSERYANGEKISFPRVELSPGTQHNYQVSDFWVQDCSYLRLKNAELGYRFSNNLLRKAGLSSMRAYVSGNNLITWTKMKYQVDPDARELWGRTYPSMRVFNLGVNLQF